MAQKAKKIKELKSSSVKCLIGNNFLRHRIDVFRDEPTRFALQNLELHQDSSIHRGPPMLDASRSSLEDESILNHKLGFFFIRALQGRYTTDWQWRH
jgi:hypothetical protein